MLLLLLLLRRRLQLSRPIYSANVFFKPKVFSVVSWQWR